MRVIFNKYPMLGKIIGVVISVFLSIIIFLIINYGENILQKIESQEEKIDIISSNIENINNTLYEWELID